MEHQLSNVERGLLLSATDRGLIPLPQGTADSMQKISHSLQRMAKARLIVYECRSGYVAYWITSRGRDLLQNLAQN